MTSTITAIRKSLSVIADAPKMGILKAPIIFRSKKIPIQKIHGVWRSGFSSPRGKYSWQWSIKARYGKRFSLEEESGVGFSLIRIERILYNGEHEISNFIYNWGTLDQSCYGLLCVFSKSNTSHLCATPLGERILLCDLILELKSRAKLAASRSKPKRVRETQLCEIQWFGAAMGIKIHLNF